MPTRWSYRGVNEGTDARAAPGVTQPGGSGGAVGDRRHDPLEIPAATPRRTMRPRSGVMGRVISIAFPVMSVTPKGLFETGWAPISSGPKNGSAEMPTHARFSPRRPALPDARGRRHPGNRPPPASFLPR